MFLFVISTLEDSSSSESEKDEKCFLSEVYEFLFLNEFEEMAGNYKVIIITAQHLLSILNLGRNGGNSSNEEISPNILSSFKGIRFVNY